MTNKYQYNAVDNILGITNAVDPTQDNANGDKKLGGHSSIVMLTTSETVWLRQMVGLSMCLYELYFKNLGTSILEKGIRSKGSENCIEEKAYPKVRDRSEHIAPSFV